jgi:hypothetical protein
LDVLKTTVGGGMISKQTFQTYLDGMFQSEDTPDKPDIASADTARIMKWRANGSVMFSWMQGNQFNNLACDPALVSATDGRTSHSLPTVLSDDGKVKTQRRLSGIITITRSPDSYRQWVNRRGIQPDTKLTEVSSEFLRGLEPLKLGLPSEAHSLLHFERTDGSQVFDWSFRGDQITQIVPSDLYHELVDSSWQEQFQPATIDESKITDINEWDRRVIEEWEKEEITDV